MLLAGEELTTAAIAREAEQLSRRAAAEPDAPALRYRGQAFELDDP